MKRYFIGSMVIFLGAFSHSLHANNDVQHTNKTSLNNTALIKTDLLSLLQKLDEALVSGNLTTVKDIARDIEAVAFKGVQQKENDQRFISDIYDDILVYTNRFKYPQQLSKDPSTPDIWLKKLGKSIDLFLKELEKPRSYEKTLSNTRPVKKSSTP